jgi:hypothetical protein
MTNFISFSEFLTFSFSYEIEGTLDKQIRGKKLKLMYNTLRHSQFESLPAEYATQYGGTLPLERFRNVRIFSR